MTISLVYEPHLNGVSFNEANRIWRNKIMNQSIEGCKQKPIWTIDEMKEFLWKIQQDI